MSKVYIGQLNFGCQQIIKKFKLLITFIWSDLLRMYLDRQIIIISIVYDQDLKV